ncbi:MAG: hypothetical protein A4E53_00336 [Pelotomaculum sp. PtaB.Bin104]|nr:MAG: hypothetical protein A4E53_00336 [Pelotomaculum sp. PtaB.Bin104]
MLKLHRNHSGQASLEMLFVLPILFMIFTFIYESGFLLYDWAVINYNTSTTAVRAATTGQFTNQIRLSLAQNMHDWSVVGKNLTYDVSGIGPPGATDNTTAYIYGTDEGTPVQRGQYIFVNVDYPWHFRFFALDALASWVIDEKNMRLHVNAAFPSEVFFE